MTMNHTPEEIRKFFSNTVLEEKAMTNELALLFRTSNSKNTGEIIREVIIPALSQSDRSLNLLPVPTLVERCSALDSAAMLCDLQCKSNTAFQGVWFEKEEEQIFTVASNGKTLGKFPLNERDRFIPEEFPVLIHPTTHRRQSASLFNYKTIMAASPRTQFRIPEEYWRNRLSYIHAAVNLKKWLNHDVICLIKVNDQHIGFDAECLYHVLQSLISHCDTAAFHSNLAALEPASFEAQSGAVALLMPYRRLSKGICVDLEACPPLELTRLHRVSKCVQIQVTDAIAPQEFNFDRPPQGCADQEINILTELGKIVSELARILGYYVSCRYNSFDKKSTITQHARLDHLLPGSAWNRTRDIIAGIQELLKHSESQTPEQFLRNLCVHFIRIAEAIRTLLTEDHCCSGEATLQRLRDYQENTARYLSHCGIPEPAADYLAALTNDAPPELESLPEQMNARYTDPCENQPPEIKDYLDYWRQFGFSEGFCFDDGVFLKRILELIADIKEKNYAKLREKITPYNRVSCHIFECETGLKPPRTARECRKMIDQFVGPEIVNIFQEQQRAKKEEELRNKTEKQKQYLWDSVTGSEENKKLLFEYLETLKNHLQAGKIRNYLGARTSIRFWDGNTRQVMMQLDYLVMIAGKTAELRQGEGYDGKMKYWCNLSNDRSVSVNKTEYDFISYLRSKTNQHEEK
jgi:hypothetical protein